MRKLLFFFLMISLFASCSKTDDYNQYIYDDGTLLILYSPDSEISIFHNGEYCYQDIYSNQYDVSGEYPNFHIDYHKLSYLHGENELEMDITYLSKDQIKANIKVNPTWPFEFTFPKDMIFIGDEREVDINHDGILDDHQTLP